MQPTSESELPVISAISALEDIDRRVGDGPHHLEGLWSPNRSGFSGYFIALGPWFEIHRNFASYVLRRLRLFDGLNPRNDLMELSKQWAEWDTLNSLVNYQSVVDTLFECLEVTGTQKRSPVADEILQHLSRDVSTVLRQIVSLLRDTESYKYFLTNRGTHAQRLLDLVQDLLDFSCDSASRPLLSKALLRLSRVSGLHPTCFVLSGLEKVDHQVAGGGFSDIWKSVVGGQTVAVKSIRIFQDVDIKEALKEFGREAVLWRQLSHPNLLPFFGLYYLDTRLCLVSPWMEHGHLLQFLKNAPSTIDRVSLILDVARGLEYLHRNKVVHGDLKAMNVLVTPANRACIADFGLSAIAVEMSLRFTHSTAIPRPGGGTVRYQAPELLSGKSSIHFGSDVYAFACVCYEILTAKSPFFDVINEMAVAINVINGHRPSRPETASQDTVWMLIEDCWKQEADQRPTMTEILQRLTSLPITAKIKQSEIDWDETYSARFRCSVRPWPLLPSITQIERRIATNRVIPGSRHNFHSTEQMEGSDRMSTFRAFAPKIRHLLEKFPGRKLRRSMEQYSLRKDVHNGSVHSLSPVGGGHGTRSYITRPTIHGRSLSDISEKSVLIPPSMSVARSQRPGSIYTTGASIYTKGTSISTTGTSLFCHSGHTSLDQDVSPPPDTQPVNFEDVIQPFTLRSGHTAPSGVTSPPSEIQVVNREDVIEPFILRPTSPLPLLACKTSRTSMRMADTSHESPAMQVIARHDHAPPENSQRTRLNPPAYSPYSQRTRLNPPAYSPYASPASSLKPVDSPTGRDVLGHRTGHEKLFVDSQQAYDSVTSRGGISAIDDVIGRMGLCLSSENVVGSTVGEHTVSTGQSTNVLLRPAHTPSGSNPNNDTQG
ncbi:hypothetical protein C8R44DRAFT_693749 [Mycena epipterygia]|nr:hypothetical protein C8R44DRAFT_693749 [Mycena epipterygia]